MERRLYNRIQDVLEEKGQNIYWLQEQLNESIPNIVRWCNNVKQPTIEELSEIAKVLNVDVRDLLVSTKQIMTDEGYIKKYGLTKEEYLKEYFNEVHTLTAKCKRNKSELWVRESYPELEIGKTYHVSHIGVYRSSTKIILREFGDKEYNSVCFDIFENDELMSGSVFTQDRRFMAPYLRKKLQGESNIIKDENIDSFQGKANVRHIISNNGNVSYITCPRSYSIEIERVKAYQMRTIEEANNHFILLVSSDDNIVGTYQMSEKLWGIHTVPLHMHKFSLAFFEKYDTDAEMWISCVGYKQDVFSLYYDEAIMSLIRMSWDTRFDNTKDFDKEFDTALFKMNVYDLQVIKEICQNSSSTDYLGIKYGLLEWDLHKRNADLVCKEYGYGWTEMMLTGFEKRLFFWSFLLYEKRKNSDRLNKQFPPIYHSYSEDNLKKLIDYYHTYCKYQWSIADGSTHNAIDAETAIMSALKNGDGDNVGL